MSADASVLYDAPGPGARRRHAAYSVLVLAALVAVGWLVWRAFDRKGQLTAAKWDPFLQSEVWQTYILPGLWGTLEAAALSIVFALVIGVVFGLLRLSDHRSVRWVAGAVVELARAVPVLILMIFLYNWFAANRLFGSDQLALAAVVFALTIYNGSVIAEIVRSGIRSLPHGQTEAAQALGLRKSQMMRSILLPQAVTAMLPALISQMVVATQGHRARLSDHLSGDRATGPAAGRGRAEYGAGADHRRRHHDRAELDLDEGRHPPGALSTDAAARWNGTRSRFGHHRWRRGRERYRRPLVRPGLHSHRA